MESKIRSFVERLGKIKATRNAGNMWDFSRKENVIRRNNLYLYLFQMAERKPKVMLVGEAPGYQGCKWTGVHFMSEYLILKGIGEIGMFGKERGYRKTAEWGKVWKEPSATIVWGALKEVKELPLIWASFPFHPYKPGEILTNRAPTREELALGRPLISELIEIYGIKKIIAVGNKAEETLGEMGYKVEKIRHPANGGAGLFKEGIKKHFS